MSPFEGTGYLREIEFNVSWNTSVMFLKTLKEYNSAYYLKGTMSWIVQFLPVPVQSITLRCVVIFLVPIESEFR